MLNVRNLCFLGSIVLVLAVFYGPLKQLTELSFQSELYSHFLLIPVVSLFFLYMNRKGIFDDVSFSIKSGVPIVLVGLLIFGIGKRMDLIKKRDFDFIISDSDRLFSFVGQISSVRKPLTLRKTGRCVRGKFILTPSSICC